MKIYSAHLNGQNRNFRALSVQCLHVTVTPMVVARRTSIIWTAQPRGLRLQLFTQPSSFRRNHHAAALFRLSEQIFTVAKMASAHAFHSFAKAAQAKALHTITSLNRWSVADNTLPGTAPAMIGYNIWLTDYSCGYDKRASCI